MGVKNWWLANFGPDVDRTDYTVFCGGSSLGGPRRRAYRVRGITAAEQRAVGLLVKHEGLRWSSICRAYGGDPVRYYRDLDNVIHRVAVDEDHPKFWVAALFLREEVRFEPAAFVVSEDRQVTIDRAKAFMETHRDSQGGWIHQASGSGGAGWIAGRFANELGRDENGAVVVTDLLEKDRLSRIAALKQELSELEGQ